MKFVKGFNEWDKVVKESVNEGIKSTIQKLFKSAKKKLGMKKVVRPIDDPKKNGPKGAYGADADIAQEVIKKGEDKKLKTTGLPK